MNVNTILKWDFINNMDHMRKLGTEPSSVILSQKVIEKVRSDAQIVPKQAQAKMNGVNNQQNFNQF